MKKYIFLFVVIMILALGSSVSAESFFAEISGDKVILRNTADDGSVEITSVPIYSLENYKYFGIRNMAESCGAEVSWDDSTKTVLVKHNDLVISLKNSSSDIFINGNKYNFGYPVIIIEGKSYAPLELYKAFTGELQFPESPLGSNQVIATEQGGLLISNGEGADRVTIKGAASNLIHSFKLSNPDRIVLDISGITIEGTFMNGETYDKIRHFKGSDGITRVVFDLKDNYIYNIDYNGNDIVVTISGDGSFSEAQELIEYRNNSVIIKTSDYDGYKIYRSTDPYTINAELPGELLSGPIKIDVDGEYVNNITAASSNGITLISIETKQQCSFELEKLSQAFVVGIYEPVVQGVTYHNTNDMKHVALDFIQGAENIISISNKSGESVIKVNDSDNTISSGQVYVNDDVVKSIFVKKTGSTAEIRITYKTTKFIKGEAADSGILQLQMLDNDYSDFLVVISPGHGGRDPGAIVNGVYESRLNLEIAFKLRQLLENAGVDVYMIRTDDSFVSLEDRTAIANNLGADLFISIHCNTLEDTSFDGLMTLVHSGYINYSHINGKTAGTIIHEELIEETGATDRGVRDRDKIIVLKDTVMPAVEIECGFLTNPAEFGKLLEDSYQWSIAKGTAEGVLRVLDLMD